MKKLTALLLVLAMCLAFAGCGGQAAVAETAEAAPEVSVKDAIPGTWVYVGEKKAYDVYTWCGVAGDEMKHTIVLYRGGTGKDTVYNNKRGEMQRAMTLSWELTEGTIVNMAFYGGPYYRKDIVTENDQKGDEITFYVEGFEYSESDDTLTSMDGTKVFVRVK